MAESESDRPDAGRCFKHLMILALVAMMIFALNRWGLSSLESRPRFFSSYLGDLLALPIYLPLSLYLAKLLKLERATFRFGIGHLLVSVLVFALIFEGLLPIFDGNTTRDPFDVLAYLGGAVLVYGVQLFCPAPKTV